MNPVEAGPIRDIGAPPAAPVQAVPSPIGVPAVVTMSEQPMVSQPAPIVSPLARPSHFASLFQFNRVAIWATGAATVLIVAIGVVSFVLLNNQKVAKNQPSSIYGASSLPLQSTQANIGQLLGHADSLAVNGQLQVNDTLVLTPNSKPTSPVIGQLYYDKTTNQPYFYNGTNFVSLLASASTPQVTTVTGGTANNYQIGSGLVLSGNRLSVAANILQAANTGPVSGSFIEDQTAAQAANFNIQAAASGSVAAVIQANAAGSGDILDLRDGAGNTVVSVGAQGSTLIHPSTNAVNALQIQNSAGSSLFNVDALNSNLTTDTQTVNVNTSSAVIQSSSDWGNSTNAFQVQDSAGQAVLNVDTANHALTVSGEPTNTLGADLITQDDYSNTTYWSTGNASSWTLGPNSASYSGSYDSLGSNQFSAVPGDTYAYSFTVSGGAGSSDCINPYVGDSQGNVICGDGVYSGYITAMGADGITLYTYTSDQTNFIGTISNISVQQVGASRITLNVEATPSVQSQALGNELSPNTDFTNAADWSVSPSGDWTLTSSSATWSASNTDYLTDNQLSLTAGANYQISFTVNMPSSDYFWITTANFTGGAGFDEQYVSPGTNTFDFYTYNNVSGAPIIRLPSTAGSISNISIKELVNTTYNPAALSVQTSSGQATLEVRAPDPTSVYVGLQSGTNDAGYDSNAALGDQALQNDTTGYQNAALGSGALRSNVSGYNNTAIGYNADVGSGNLQNATAIGAFAQVDESNALVLGCNISSNGCTQATDVGINTSTPAANLDVIGTLLDEGALTATTSTTTPLISGGGLAPTTYAANVLATSGLSSYWRLGETSGAMVDQVGGINGTVTDLSGCSGAHYVRGASGGITGAAGDDGAFQINKDSCYGNGAAWVDMGNNYGFTGNTPFTVETWVNIPQGAAGDGNETIISKTPKMPYLSGGSGWGIFDLYGDLEFDRVDSSGAYDAIDDYNMPTGWNYVAATYDGNTMKLYDNGQLVGTRTSTRAVGANTTNLMLGHQGGDYYTGMVGTVDETAIYNQALAASAISQHYLIGAATVPTGSLQLTSNATATKGLIYLGSATAFNEASNELGVGTTAPSATLDVAGTAHFKNASDSTAAFQVQDAAGNDMIDVDTQHGYVGVGTNTPGNLLSVGSLTTVAPSTEVAISTGGTTNSGIVVQNVSGQTSGYVFQAQDNTGVILASVDYQGNLVVKSATISGILTLNGHLVTANSSGTTSAVLQSAAGSGGSPSCTVSGSDTAGLITLITGTSGWAAGAQCSITFSSAFIATPHPILTPTGSTNTSSVAPTVTPSTGGFTVNFINADTGQHTYTWDYFNAQ